VAPTYVVLYLQELLDASERDGIGPSRVLSASSAIACLHWLHGIESPTQHPLCDTVREASRRLLTGRRLERDAVTAADIRRLVDKYGKRRALLRDLMHVTAFSLMYAAFLRFDDLCQITVHEDALVFRDDHLAIFVPKSKTDQQGEGRWVVVAKGQGEYCPVGLLDRLLRKGEYITRPRSPDEDVGPLVRAVDKSGMKLRQVTAVGALVPPLSYTTLLERCKTMCKEAGITTAITLHSFRIGGATAAAAAGVEHQAIKEHGRWRSDSSKDRYVRGDIEGALEVSRALAL